MNIMDYTVSGFTGLLASDAPAPGGGSAAALQGALGAALIHMVAGLTVGKKKYEEYRENAEEILRESGCIRQAFLEVADKDTKAFNDVTAALSLPKTTEDEKAARKAAMQSALKGCTLTPFETARLSLDALRLAEKSLGKTNVSAASDLGVAALSLKAAAQGAWLNILINVSSINDTAFAQEYRTKGGDIVNEAITLADKIYNETLSIL